MHSQGNSRMYDNYHIITGKTCLLAVIGIFYHGGYDMGYVFAEVTLKNPYYTTDLEHGISKESEFLPKTVQALVDTGCYSIVITEELRRELGLVITGRRGISLADNTRITCQIAGPIEIRWKDRYSVLPALVVPDRPNVLLGALPLKDMDLIVDPVRQEVSRAHGDEWVCYI